MTQEQVDEIARIATAFPSLVDSEWKVTSDADSLYNCIAWAAAEDKRRWWWPAVEPADAYWPDGVGRSESLDAFKGLFDSLGYGDCDHTHDAANTERVAIFVQDSAVTHAARQLSSGAWTSKLGHWADISHDLDGIVGER